VKNRNVPGRARLPTGDFLSAKYLAKNRNVPGRARLPRGDFLLAGNLTSL